ncbi:capsule biosynthesis protein [Aliigemmobacter aestuarii]|uniref:Capsule biosynthesis protein n=1 Tax=Aliigemmobacter aestuarii TaxID=1445661 RepID=A0A4S3MND0_9RHOB|nr:capsule biosynthesis protein [Gemmobacter aestuarii]THD83033.1 capsule biosynthesis protein [Gemmobacter aestuarii]
MTTKLSVQRFRTRRPDPVALPAPAAREVSGEAMFAPPSDDGFGAERFPSAAAPAPSANPAAEIEAIRREGLTGRQLRMARRTAQRHNLPATSDFDAVRLLRNAGIDPFQPGVTLDPETESGGGAPPSGGGGGRALATLPGGDGVRLPQTIKPIQVPSTEVRAEHSYAADILKIQRDIARRRRRKAALLATRLAFFVMLPTLLTAFYFYVVATPLFATKTEFVIQQAQNPTAGAGGLGGLLQGSPLATSQDSIAVQGYLQSRDAMLRLDQDLGFRSHFNAADIDPIQRLDPDASLEDAYKTYKRNVKIAYDPTEGIIKMEVIAPDPQVSASFSKALIGYAEEQVDHLTQRLREDQMQGARESYERAEVELAAANRRVVELQERTKILSSEVEVSLITTQIGQLETQLSADRLSLQQMESNANPNQARMDPLKRRIAALEAEIATLRSRLTEGEAGGQSLAQVQSELLVAQADVQTRQLLLANALQAMETARQDANRQVRYLSVSVNPVAPDEPTYPRAFENTAVALLVFAGIYLMISMTVAILREQVSA